MRVVVQVPMADGDEFFEVICQELAANLQATDRGLDRTAVDKRCNGCMGVARVD